MTVNIIYYMYRIFNQHWGSTIPIFQMKKHIQEVTSPVLGNREAYPYWLNYLTLTSLKEDNEKLEESYLNLDAFHIKCM